jgi:hypothetical protein
MVEPEFMRCLPGIVLLIFILLLILFVIVIFLEILLFFWASSRRFFVSLFAVDSTGRILALKRVIEKKGSKLQTRRAREGFPSVTGATGL